MRPARVLFALALLPSAWTAWRARDGPHLGYLHDDAIYWVCAQSLAAGHGYRIASLPGEPYQTKYPPLYSLLLSAIWRIDPLFPRNLALAHLLAWLMVPFFVLWGRPSACAPAFQPAPGVSTF